MALNRNPQSWVLTLIVAGSVMAYAFFVFLPMRKSIAELKAQLTERRQYIVAVNDRYLQKDRTRQRLESVRQYVNHWNGQPAEAPLKLSRVLAELTRIAAQSELTVQRVTPMQATSHGVLKEFSLNFELEGTFPQVFAFLRRVESLPFAVWTQEVSMQAGEATRDQASCKLQIAVFTDNPSSSD